MQTLFCDVDNTINNHFKRIKKWTDRNGKCNWKKAFLYNEIMKDKVLDGAKEAISHFACFYKIVFLTARNFPHAYNVTKDWLDKNNFIYDEIIVVKSSKEKLKYVIEPDCLFIDDLSRKHEINPPYTVWYNDVISELDRLNVNYEIFYNNWDYIVEKYLAC